MSFMKSCKPLSQIKCLFLQLSMGLLTILAVKEDHYNVGPVQVECCSQIHVIWIASSYKWWEKTNPYAYNIGKYISQILEGHLLPWKNLDAFIKIIFNIALLDKGKDQQSVK